MVLLYLGLAIFLILFILGCVVGVKKLFKVIDNVAEDSAVEEKIADIKHRSTLVDDVTGFQHSHEESIKKAKSSEVEDFIG